MEMYFFIILILIILSPFLFKYVLLKENYKGKDRIFYDKSELILLVNNGSKRLYPDNIKKIVFRKCKHRKFLIWPVADKCIEIYSGKRTQPFSFYKSREKEKFEMYIDSLLKYSKKNRVKLENKLEKV